MQGHCPCRGQVHQVAPLPAEAEAPCLGSLLPPLATGLPKQGLDLPLCDSPLLQVSVPGLPSLGFRWGNPGSCGVKLVRKEKPGAEFTHFKLKF